MVGYKHESDSEGGMQSPFELRFPCDDALFTLERSQMDMRINEWSGCGAAGIGGPRECSIVPNIILRLRGSPRAEG
jgi:hypothetical protein